MSKIRCASFCCGEEDCPCGKVCSDEGYCDNHFYQERREYSYLRRVPAVWVLNEKN